MSRSTRVISHSSDFGRWEWLVAQPSPILRPYVTSYAGGFEHAVGYQTRREVPTGDVVIIIGMDSTIGVHRPGDQRPIERVRAPFVSGVWDTYAETETGDGWAGLQVSLTPIGAFRLLRNRLDELSGDPVRLDDVIGAAAERLLDRLHATADWPSRVEVLDAFLARRVAGALVADPRVEWAVDALDVVRPPAVGDLARDVGWSHKHLISKFHEQVGVPPRTLARIKRFQRALGLAERQGAAVDWTDLALRSGYYDQAHLIRDFRQFAGSPPEDLLRRMLPDHGGVVDDLGAR